jgi:hypothetical protein
MRAWQFSKPKTPGFGISKGYYLSVLSSHATLPSLRQLLNPKGENGAVSGFGVPLAAHADKSAIDQPLQRGAYGLAAKDQKTVLRLMVVSKEEAGFDPETVARSFMAAELGPEAMARIRGTWTLCQLSFESHHPMVYPALDFFLAIASRLALLTEGVVADPIAQRYLLPDQVFSRRRLGADLPILAEEHVSPKFRSRPDGVHAYTLGMQKFVMHELEISNLMDGDESNAALALLWLAQAMLQGTKVEEGYQVGAPKTMFEVREGGFDRSLWEGIPVYELLPPTSVTTSEAIEAWVAEIVGQKAQ